MSTRGKQPATVEGDWTSDSEAESEPDPSRRTAGMVSDNFEEAETLGEIFLDSNQFCSDFVGSIGMAAAFRTRRDIDGLKKLVQEPLLKLADALGCPNRRSSNY
jgi:hypothetical protein